MKIALRRIGNSKVLIIPTAILNQLGLKDKAELVLKDGALVIRPSEKKSRAGWADASKALAAAGEYYTADEVLAELEQILSTARSKKR